MRATNRVIINKPVEDVFHFVARGENAPLWRPGAVSVRLRSGSEGAAGAVYEQRVKGPMGGSVPADYEITSVNAPHELQFRAITGPVRPEGSYHFEDSADGTTVTFSLSCEPQGLAKLMSPMVAKAMESEVASLSNLKRVLEGS